MMSCQTTQDLGSSGMRTYLDNLKIGWIKSLVASVPSRNKILAVAVKNHAKAADIKVFWSCLVWINFFALDYLCR